MRKIDRQRLIKNILKNYHVQKQEEFVEILKAQGVDVTQATVSRDIKEMQLIKVPDENNTFRYSVPVNNEKSDRSKMSKMFHDAFVSMKSMDKFLVIRTIPGSAPALGLLVEKVFVDEIFTVLSNDDKVLIIGLTQKSVEAIQLKLNDFISD